MKPGNGSTILSLGVLATAMIFSAASLNAQSDSGAKQDMKNAGHETKDAAKDTGRGIKHGTKKAYHGTKKGTKKAYHATGHGLKKVGNKMDGKPDSQ
ncbi:MAG TPA: hypothetical protein VGD64_16200 [Acidisarcina sp.]